MNSIYKSVQQERVPSNKLIENVDYYFDKESGLMVLTSFFHIKRGFCCGNGCRECPYYPKHEKGNTNTINEDTK